MGALRKLQRESIRHRCYQRDHHKRAFKDEWDKVHYGVTEEVDKDGKVIATKSKKKEKRKQGHFDNGKVYIRHIQAVKAFVESMRNKDQNKSNMNAKAKVC